MSDKREYLKKWRKDNKSKVKIKNKVYYAQNLLETENRIFPKLLRDIAHRCQDGVPDFTNPHHIALLEETLLGYGWPDNSIEEFRRLLLRPILIGQKKHQELLDKKKSDKLSEALSEYLEEEKEEEEEKETWKYCPHCGKEINNG